MSDREGAGAEIDRLMGTPDAPLSERPPVDPLNAAYRERNAVVAALIRTNGWSAALVPAPDARGWFIVYAETPEGQVSSSILRAARRQRTALAAMFLVVQVQTLSAVVAGGAA